MRILIIGNGGREHALAWALSNSPLLSALFVAPGNPGTASLATNVAIGVLDVAALVAFAEAERIDLVVPGPEAPLVAGIADALTRLGIRCFGPTAAAAMLEGSKAFAKEIADASGIPTAAWERFTDADAALAFIRLRGAPIVIKADGLAAGKGVTVALTVEEAEDAVQAAMVEGALGEAGASIVIEECLTGDEVSLFAVCDGTDAVLLGAAQDHKRALDGDTGPNTGGMGAVSPPAGFGMDAQRSAVDVFVRPALAEMAARGAPFRGVLFAGLMLTPDGPKLIEYNVRLGDPEAQVLLPRLRTDMLAAMLAACDGELGHFTIVQDALTCLGVVLAARGYPGAFVKGGVIKGLQTASAQPHVAVFHAGTEIKEGAVTASGGRVLTICATGADLASARASAYAGVAAITWEDKMFRTDIGLRAQIRAAGAAGA